MLCLCHGYNMNNTLRNFYAFNGMKKSYCTCTLFFSPLWYVDAFCHHVTDLAIISTAMLPPTRMLGN